MIQTENHRQQEILKEIIDLTMQLKARHGNIYEHLDETPVFKSNDSSNEMKAMEDYRNTLLLQLKEGDIQDKKNNL
jgi:hypothetical protein